MNACERLEVAVLGSLSALMASPSQDADILMEQERVMGRALSAFIAHHRVGMQQETEMGMLIGRARTLMAQGKEANAWDAVFRLKALMEEQTCCAVDKSQQYDLLKETPKGESHVH